jgi:integrase
MRLNLLNALKVKQAKKTISDGGGLMLNVKAKTGSKSWMLRYTWGGKQHLMGLGSYPDFGLSDARELAQKLREGIVQGVHPAASRDALREVNRKATAPLSIIDSDNQYLFANCAERYIESHRSEWKNVKHIAQWRSTIKTYATPHFGGKHIDKLGLDDIKSMLDPIWLVKPETASRVQSRVERILDWATVMGYRSGDNPCRWKSFLQEIYPAPEKVKLQINGGEQKHHASMPYEDVPIFYTDLAKRNGVAALALRFTILTAARSGEVFGATWDEVDLDKKVWVIPARRMKMKKEHVVPLSEEMINILGRVPELNDYIFAGQKRGKPLSNMAMTMLLRKMGHKEYTVHGFRSSFRTWAEDRCNYRHSTLERALAHAIKGVEKSYNRGKQLDKRRRLMGEWNLFVN